MLSYGPSVYLQADRPMLHHISCPYPKVESGQLDRISLFSDQRNATGSPLYIVDL